MIVNAFLRLSFFEQKVELIFAVEYLFMNKCYNEIESKNLKRGYEDD